MIWIKVRFAVGLGLPMMVLFAAFASREWLLDAPLPSVAEAGDALGEAEPAFEEPAAEVAAPEAPPIAPPPAPAPPLADDAPVFIVPADLAAPLRAVAPEVKLCIPEALERDRGPLDVEVHFTPTSQGGFAGGTEVTTSWDDEQHSIASCIAEVFDEASFWPQGAVRTSRAAFVFHFPDDAMQGLLGMRWSPFE